MNINISFDIPDALAVRLITKRGYKIVKHNFSTNNYVSHIDEESINNVQAAVYIDGQYFRLHDAFMRIYKFKIQQSIIQSLK